MLAAMRERAEAANVPFTTFAFDATGTTTPRTMPDRLAEVKNVLDFGADATGANPSDVAVQAAVNSNSGANRGTIFFPAGSYKFNNPVTLNFNGALRIAIIGEGQATSILTGSSFPSGGFLFDRSLVSPSNQAQIVVERILFTGGIGGGGAVRLGSCISATVRDCAFSGDHGLTFEDSPGNSSTGILVENCKFPGSAIAALVMGGSGAVLGCDWTQADVAAWMYGNGWFMAANRMENCNTGTLVGLTTATGASFTGSLSVVGGVLQLVATSVTGTIVPGQRLRDLLGNVPPGITIYSGPGGGGAGTYNCSFYPSLSVGSQAMTTQGVDAGLSSGWSINSSSNEGNLVAYDLAGTCTGFYMNAFGHEGHDVGNAGSPNNIQASQRGLIVRGGLSTNGVFSGGNVGNFETFAAAEIQNASSRANLFFLNCDFKSDAGGGANWILPTNAFTALFQSCNIDPIWTFSQLPTGGNVLEGDQFSISDGTNSLTWGQPETATGTHTTHRLVRYNGSSYTIVAQ